jgi:hypothetical protein
MGVKVLLLIDWGLKLLLLFSVARIGSAVDSRRESKTKRGARLSVMLRGYGGTARELICWFGVFLFLSAWSRKS